MAVKDNSQERITISMPRSMVASIQAEMEAGHFTSVSEWIRGVIRRELSHRSTTVSNYVVPQEEKERRLARAKAEGLAPID